MNNSLPERALALVSAWLVLLVATPEAQAQEPGRTWLPVADWSGTLELPSPSERRADGGVWMTVENAPALFGTLKGDRVWVSYDPDNEALMERASRVVVDVSFTDEIQEARAEQNLHPDRLDGWTRISALESLAGAHNRDDVRVRLDRPLVVASGSATRLRLQAEPTLVAGTHVALLRFHPSKTGEPLVARHFRRQSHRFDGAWEQLSVVGERARSPGPTPLSSTKNIDRSPLNAKGWYVHATHGPRGWTVVALEPRSLFELRPTTTVRGSSANRFLRNTNWRDTDKRRGEAWKVALTPRADGSLKPWRRGDRALLVHLFGSIGGPRGEKKLFQFLATGHFSFGVATVVQNRFTGEDRLAVVYQQVYGNNYQGIISASSDWSVFMGSLVRGWMYQRPVSDLLLRLDPLTTPLQIAGLRLDPLLALQQELEVMMARYRTGDGSGGIVIGPASSCVQDSTQAAFVALARLNEEMNQRPEVARARKADPSAQAARQLAQLNDMTALFARRLSPLGFLRADWRSAGTLAVVDRKKEMGPLTTAARAALSAKTVLPRSAHDVIGETALEYGAEVWVLRTDQIGGEIEGIAPISPKSLLRRR